MDGCQGYDLRLASCRTTYFLHRMSRIRHLDRQACLRDPCYGRPSEGTLGRCQCYGGGGGQTKRMRHHAFFTSPNALLGRLDLPLRYYKFLCPMGASAMSSASHGFRQIMGL